MAMTGGQAAHAEQRADFRCWYNAPEHVTCVPKSEQAQVQVRHRFLHIPLHTVPVGTDGMKMLAQAVVCGRMPGCRMDFTRELPTAMELDEMMDPLLAQLD